MFIINLSSWYHPRATDRYNRRTTRRLRARRRR